MSITFSTLPSAATTPPASADAADVRLALMRSLPASLILLTDCLEVGAVILIVTKLVAVVAICVAEVLPRRLHGDAASRDTS